MTALLFFVGIVSGWLNVMAGGGSILTVPIMLFMGISAPVANGTNRLGIIFQNMAAVYGFFRRGFSDFKLSLLLAFCASLGAIAGAMIGTKLDGVLFNYFLVGVMVAVLVLMVTGGEKKVEQTAPPKKHMLVLGCVLMVGAGFWGGLIQIGVGFILMPILNRVIGLDLVRTNMHKVFIALSYSLFALWIFASEVGVMWTTGIFLACGTMIGGYLGAHTSVAKGEKWIKIVFYVISMVFIVKLLWF